MTISMDELGRRFASAYEALYRTRDGLAGYREAVEAFDARNGDVVMAVWGA